MTGLEYKKDSQVLRNLTYGYNELNQRTAYTGNPVPAPQDSSISSTVTNSLNQYTSLNGQVQTFDENGNQRTGGLTATWDARDRLVSLVGTGFTASFQYDASGRRVGKTLNGKTQTYLYDGADIIQESGTKNATYTQGTGIDEPLLRKAGNQREYYLADALGSIVGLMDESAAITTSYSYSPYGKKATAGFASDSPYGFTAREDDGTGLYFYRARYYSPEQKRFIAEDSIGFESGDSNFYAYVGGDPVNATDPSGNSPLLTEPPLSSIACPDRCMAAFPRGRKPPVIQDGNFKEGWTHIDARHIPGLGKTNQGDLFAPGTTRAMLQAAVVKIVGKGVRVSDHPSRRLQSFEDRLRINGQVDVIKAIVDVVDCRVITVFPVQGGE